MTKEELSEDIIDMEDIPVNKEDASEEIDLDKLSDKKLGEKMEKPRLDGQEFIITKVELKATVEEKKTKDNKKTYKPVLFKVYYGEDNFENYGGVAQFKFDGEFNEPTIWTDGMSASAKLFRLWLKTTGKQVEDVSFKDFFSGLKGKKVKIKTKTTEYEGREYVKNIIEAFI